MATVNKVIIVGRLGQDPEVRQFQNGGSVTNINVATSESWTDKMTGERKEQTEWHRVALFNRLGEIAAQYLRKGSLVYIEGSLNTRKWQDQQGIERHTTEIRATNMTMLGDYGQGGHAGRGGNTWAGGRGEQTYQNAGGYANDYQAQQYHNQYPRTNQGYQTQPHAFNNNPNAHQAYNAGMNNNLGGQSYQSQPIQPKPFNEPMTNTSSDLSSNQFNHQPTEATAKAVTPPTNVADDDMPF